MTDTYLDNENEEFLKLLFRPEYAVQTRELNALQTILQRQISNLGDYTFKEGAAVIGGSISQNNAKTLKVESSYLGSAITLSDWVGKDIVEYTSANVATGATGKVFAVSSEDGSDPAALHYISTSTTAFDSGAVVRIADTSTYAAIKTASEPNTECQVVRLLDGIFYFDRRFVSVSNQILVFSKFSTDFSGRVGLVFEQDIVTEFTDTSLYDPARGSENYNAPGAHREKFNVTLASYTYNETVPDNFISLVEFQSGEQKTRLVKDENHLVNETIAKVIKDQSGDFVVEEFTNTLLEKVEKACVQVEPSPSAVNTVLVTMAYLHDYEVGDSVTLSGATGTDAAIYNGTYTITELVSDTQFNFQTLTPTTTTETSMKVYRPDYFGMEISSGVAYVEGFRVNIPYKQIVEVRKGRDILKYENYLTTAQYGNYTVVDNLSGVFDPTTVPTINLVDAGSTVIGSAKMRSIVYDSGTIGAAAAQYRVYLYDVSIDPGSTAANVAGITSGTATADINGVFAMQSSNINSLVFPIADYSVSSIKPDGTDTTSFYTKFAQSQTSGSGTYTFIGGAAQTFLGTVSTDIAGTVIADQHYMFVDTATGNVLDPLTLTLNVSGQSVVATFAVNTTVRLIATVTDNTALRAKHLNSQSTAIAGGAITSAARTASLGYADVYQISGIYESGTNGTAATNADTNITDRFDFDNGQRDAFYDHASITLKSGVVAPEGDVLVEFEYFAPNGNGFFAADSYGDISLDNVPNYTFQTSGVTVNLRDVIDFRPVRDPNLNTHSNTKIPTPNSPISSDFNFFLGRRDIVAFDRYGNAEITEGISSRDPKYPTVPDDQMLLFKVDVGAYVDDYKDDVNIQAFQNRRYDMRDIGFLDDRIERIEYETSLSLLESDAKSKNIVDASGASRFKTGFIVDGFSGHGIGDSLNPDYRVSVDREKKTARPAFDSNLVDFELETLNGVEEFGTDATGKFVMLPYTTTELVSNDKASKGVSVNPYLVTKKVGSLALSPASDYWVDKTTSPVLDVNFTGDNDTWLGGTPIETGNAPGFGTIWNDWETTWTGSQGVSTRSGRQTTFAYETVTKSLGNKLIDTNLSLFMRAIDVTINVSNMRPNTDLHVFVDDENVNDIVTAGSAYGPTSEGSLRSDSNGFAQGTLSIPASRFRTGERIVTVTDEQNKVLSNATTVASFVFAASGLITTSQETSVSIRTLNAATNVVSETVTTSRPAPTTTTTTVATQPTISWSRFARRKREKAREKERKRKARDPLAQDFVVDDTAFPNGVFVSDLNVYMKAKPTDTSENLIVQLRPMVNGYPDSYNVLPMSEVVIPWSDVNIPTLTADITSVRSSPTSVSFPVPVYMAPGDYCLVLLSDNAEYEAYVSEMGQSIVGSNVRISKQPTLGSLFRSQNAKTWTATQTDDLMFDLNICQFSTAGASFTLKNSVVASDTKFNLIKYNPQRLVFPDTVEEYTIESISSSTGAVGDATTLIPDTNVEFDEEHIVQTTAQSMKIVTTLLTTDQYVSPMYDMERVFGIVVHNKVNNLGLLTSGIVIDNPGTGYTTATVTITSNDDGTNAAGSVVLSGGRVTGINIDTEGQNYTTAPTITITGDGAGASVSYVGFESDPTGGNALARYLSNPVTLADGFVTDQATVYIDATLAPGTDIKLYQRSVSSEDSEPLSQKSWVEMTSGDKKNTAPNEFVEFRYDVDLSYTANTVNYPTVKSVQFKVVLLSENTSIVPEISNFRAITSI